uniref:Ig-like domain-containing protein n=1 Tax=Leptobrachium leishanense TaxID=445787 RepID=A0A8C5PJB2_9ANUR
MGQSRFSDFLLQDKGVLFSFLYYTGILRACEVTVSQPAVHKAVVSQHSVTLPCQIKEPRCPGDFDTYWFRYLASGYEELDTAAHNSRFSSKKSAFNTTLKIKGLQIEDSGVYVCGIAFNDAAATGIGTTLVVREIVNSHRNRILIYLLAGILTCLLYVLYNCPVFTHYTLYSAAECVGA